MITGTGIDIVDLAAFRRRIADDYPAGDHPADDHSGQELQAELFLPLEIEYCHTQARYWENFAARFAAKEATFKALGAGLQEGLRWHDVEVVRDPAGPVSLKLHGKAAQLAELQGVTSKHLSLSHCSQFAIAMVVLESITANPKPEA